MMLPQTAKLCSGSSVQVISTGFWPLLRCDQRFLV